MGSSSSCSVEIRISNKTQNITLKNPRTYFGLGSCSKYPWPELSPGSSDTCSFLGETTSVKGILVYEAESFTLAIYFHNPIDRNVLSTELGLELSSGKAHLGDLEATHNRMARGTYSSSWQDIEFTRVTVTGNHRTAQLSHGPIKVMATMSKSTRSMIKVVLEEQRESEDEAWGKNPWDIWGAKSTSSEDEYDRLFLRRALKP